jgi:hypothetical protein
MEASLSLGRARAVARAVGYLARSYRIARIHSVKLKTGDRMTDLERAEAVKVYAWLSACAKYCPEVYTRAMELYYG